MAPPFDITPEILDRISEIERLIGRIESPGLSRPQPRLRKASRIRTIQGSLAIEGNTLSLDQVTALLEGKRVIGEPDEIREVLNANEAYDLLPEIDPNSVSDLLRVHAIMMKDLISSAGQWRRGDVGILKGSAVAHVAPPADRVHPLMLDLLSFLKEARFHPLVLAGVFHYELEFIHPFEDGNGRMGRYWHSLMLATYHPVFEVIPIESIIRERQEEYYRALELSDRAGTSTAFIHFSLSVLREALEQYLEELKPSPLTAAARLDLARTRFSDEPFSRKDYLQLFKEISTATASRDLKAGLESGLLQREGERAQSIYRFYGGEQ